MQYISRSIVSDTKPTEPGGCFLSSISEQAAFCGANGMEYVREYSMRFPETLVVWITDDKYFAGEAIRRRIYDFIVRPYDGQCFRETAIKLASEPGKNGAVSKVIGGTPTL